MENEIYIDGVNVAGCEYLCTNQMGNNCLNHNQGFSMNCKNTSNCYYKQLKRLEQEHKELKKFFDSAAKKNTKLENKIKEYHDEYDKLYWTTDQLVKDKTKLKQSLEEIRDVIANIPWKDCRNILTYEKLLDAMYKIKEILLGVDINDI